MFKVNQKVQFTDASAHTTSPWFYPPVGWHGTIKELDGDAEQALVEWGGQVAAHRLTQKVAMLGGVDAVGWR